MKNQIKFDYLNENSINKIRGLKKGTKIYLHESKCTQTYVSKWARKCE